MAIHSHDVSMSIITLHLFHYLKFYKQFKNGVNSKGGGSVEGEAKGSDVLSVDT